MLAAFDVSNTRVTVGIFRGPELCCSFSLAVDARRTADEYGLFVGSYLREEGVPQHEIRGAAIASVVPPLTGTFEHVCTRLFHVDPLTVGSAATRTGIRISTRNPREVGSDRIVNAIAVQSLHGPPSIVVDFDTATTFDVVGADGSYAGSVIAPGLALSAETLAQRTARLPMVDLVEPEHTIGKDTVSALQSGLVYGHVALVEGLVKRIQEELGQPATVVATGELAPFLARQTTCIDHVEPALSLIGLRLFYEHNVHDL